LGVRLASSDVGPICLIDANDKPLDDGEPGRRKAGSEDKDQQEAHWVNQRRQLIRLFRPREYTLDAYSEPVKAGFLECNKIIDNKAIDGEDIVDRSALRHDGTYRTIVDAYDWTQDRITLPPHQALRASIESLIGKDPQQTGNKIVLYSARKEFDGEIASSIRERWIAAWYYLRYRYSSNTFGKSEVIRDELSRLSETVLHNLTKVEDERYSRIRQDINEIKIQLGKLASPQLE